MPKLGTRTPRIKRLLNDGWPVARIAKRVGVTRSYIYQLARKYNWPTNPTIARGGILEAKILRAARILTLPELCTVYATSPRRMRKVLARIDARPIP